MEVMNEPKRFIVFFACTWVVSSARKVKPLMLPLHARSRRNMQPSSRMSRTFSFSLVRRQYYIVVRLSAGKRATKHSDRVLKDA